VRSAADSQVGETPPFFAELVLEGTQRGGKEIVTVKGARIAGLQRQGMVQFNPVSVPLSWTLKLRRRSARCSRTVIMPPSNLEVCKPGHANCAVDDEKKKAEDQAENPEVFSVDVSAAVIDG
jgi:hypothetical protein